MKIKKVIIGLTYGDPAGIGPEILLKTINSWRFKSTPLIVGNPELLSLYKKHFKKRKNKLLLHKFNDKKLNKTIPGKPNKTSALHSYQCLKEATTLAMKKKIRAIFTGPVSKSQISSTGVKFVGQTDEMAKLCGLKSEDVIMIFVSKDFRIALFTRHVPLKSVSSLITKTKLKKYLLLLNYELIKHLHIKKPKIGIVGLNPHASEGGLFGNEEKSIISPVIKELKRDGLNIDGPLSPDATLAGAGRAYLLKKKQKYDIYVSFYHDQALPLFKAVAGKDGVNVTLGLPFLRVSVDHGTAFDIAGKNIADNASVVSSLKFLDSVF